MESENRKYNDLFDAEIEWPSRLCIVASGSSVNGNLDKIPADCKLLALNSAVLLPLRFDYWLVADPDAVDKGSGQGRPEYPRLRIFSRACVDRGYYADLVFSQEPDGWDALIPRVLRSGATVLGQAFQLCAHFGMDACVIGADMGDRYFDGSATHGKFQSVYLDRLQAWLRLLQEMGRSVEFLTPSPLGSFINHEGTKGEGEGRREKAEAGERQEAKAENPDSAPSCLRGENPGGDSAPPLRRNDG